MKHDYEYASGPLAAQATTPRRKFSSALVGASVVLLLGSVLLIPGKAFAITKAQRVKLLAEGLRQIKVNKKLCGKGAKILNVRTSPCDPDHDRLPTYLEKRFHTRSDLSDTDSDGLTDYQELRFYGTNPRKADTDGDGLSDGDEVHRYGTNPLKADSDGDGIPDGQEVPAPTPDPSGCQPQNFDSSGNTSGFGIPNGVSGNVAAGNAFYDQRCMGCHAYGGNLAARHGYHRDYASLNTAVRGIPMFITNLSAQELANLVASLNQDIPGGGNCTQPSPSPTPGSGLTPTPTPSPTPYVPPTPCAGGNFDGQGNTTAFGIPTPLVGNITAGQNQYNSTCGAGGCHGATVRNPGAQFAFLKNAVTNPPMSLSISDQAVANIVAYLNQADTGGCATGTPTPTPTVNPVTYGMQIFTSSCGTSGCHNPGAGGRPRHMDYHPSRNQIHEALRTGPDEMPQFLYFTLGSSAPPYSSQEEALYQYLHSIP